MVLAEDAPDPGADVDFEPWEGEPSSMDQLMDLYIVESKFAGRVAGTSMYLTLAPFRNGVRKNVVDDQEFKLFMVTWFVWVMQMMKMVRMIMITIKCC